ncbi:MAG: class II fumarate hydratase [Candidatus Polarisedimenticolaceae bacterium]|nr:class II fumarate hydratase [Candidatus Polarisedimenticolaceae bacterium]
MSKPGYREVSDSMGRLEVPSDALYAAQTQRALNNFPMSSLTMPPRFIQATAMIKRAAAEVNAELGLIKPDIAAAITAAADEIIAGKHSEQFPVDLFQTGSGTSTNMNLNEVLATLANRHVEGVSPNDHVNMGQSSNDVIPTAIHLSAAIALEEQLLPALNHLALSIESKGIELDGICKTGRTHLMDAMPIRLDQELSGWATQIHKGVERIESSLPRLHQLAQGGTAVGTGINTPLDFPQRIADKLSHYTGLPLTPSSSLFESLSCQDTAVELSGQLKVIAVSIMKISNDLRWMNSGPLAGLAEIELPPLQPGSSIMPGKVNPVIPEATAMIAAQVIGNDTTITVAGQSGNFQLNTMLPVIAYNLLQSIELLTSAAQQLADKAIKGFKIREENLQHPLIRNPILVTTLAPIIGYLKAAEIAKMAYEKGRPLIDIAVEETQLSRHELASLLNPINSTLGGIQK